jgi:hypothetical protein
LQASHLRTRRIALGNYHAVPMLNRSLHHA